MGDENTFSPIAISAPSQTSDAFVAKYFYQSPSIVSDSLDTSLYSMSRCNYWSLNRVVGSSNVNVKLYWDSLGCTLFDTTNLRVAQFIGASWKSHGKSNLLGDVNIGSVENSTSLSSYGYFTLASKYIPVTVTMTLASATRPLEVDFFGFNGSNTIDLDAFGNSIQTWDDLFSTNVQNSGLKTLAHRHINTLRYPAGTLSNYFDWRSGWFLREKRLPNGWLYDKSGYKVEPNSYAGNEFSNFADNANLTAARPILVWNLLTSKFHYELASIYRVGEVNLPLNYIELGNEFYLNDEHNKDVFPSVDDYINKSKNWIANFKGLNIPQTTLVKLAIVGADASEKTQGRRKMWLSTVLDRLSPSDEVDAITIHDYVDSGLKVKAGGSCFITGSSYLKKYLNKAFIEGEKIKTGTFDKITQANLTKFAIDPLEIWITEFNNLDDENGYIGTWPHGLFNAAMALKYLETNEISKVMSHTMVSNGVFGNIFESDCGFEKVKCHGVLPSNLCGSVPITYKGEFTALGNALNQVALALENATEAQAIIFSGAINPIDNVNQAPAYPSLYGWYLTNSLGEEQVIILNLDFANDYVISNPQTFLSNSSFNFEQIFCSDPQNAIVGNPQFQPTNSFRLQIEQGILISSSQILKAGSITRFYLQTPPLSVKLTDNEICGGTFTTLAIDCGNTNQISVSGTGLTITQLNTGTTTNDHYWKIEAPSVNATTTIPITVSCTGCTTVVVNLTLHENIIDLQITSNGSPVTAIDFCPSPNNSITLEASFKEGNGGTITNHNVNDYHFIWAPDTGITANTCTGSDLPFCNEITVSPERTTRYTVYVTDNQCWQSAYVIINTPIDDVELGPDRIVCVNPANSVSLNPLVEASSTNLSYSWSTSETSSSITCITTNVQDDNYTITVTDIPSGCTATDNITIHVVECCSPTTGIAEVNAQNYYFPGEVIPVYFSSGDDLYYAVVNTISGCTTCAVFSTNTLQGNNNSLLTIDGSGQSLVLNFEGEFRILNDKRDNSVQPSLLAIDGFDITIKNATLEFGQDAFIHVRDGRTLTLENCTLDVCTTKMWEGIKVFGVGAESPPNIITKNCIIRNSKSAIQLSRDAGYEIENIVFEDNFKDIAIEKYQQKVKQNVSIINDPLGYSQSNYIRGCTFISSGNTLLSPYSTVHKFAGITLSDVEGVVIGDSSLSVLVSENVFSNSNYGIHSINSSFDCYHSSFSDITNYGGAPLGRPIKGVCIYSSSSSDFNDRSMNVGVTTIDASLKNYFLKSDYGVFSMGEMNAKIFNNVFGDLNDIDNRITNTGIFTVNSSSKKVYISRNNNFYFYNIGIRANGLNSFGEYHIGNNYFSHTMSIPTIPLNFEGTAIWVGNSYFLKNTNTPPNLQIFENEIGSPDDLDGQPRIGIYVSLANTPIVQNNHIYFNHSSVPDAPTLGIWMQNTERAFINGNDIINTTTSNTLTNLFLGIRSDRNLTPCISGNTIDYLGNSILFFGDHGQVSLSKNKMHFYDNAISLIKADIGVQGFFDINTSDSRSDENEFYHNTGSEPDRVIGSVGNSNLPLTWYFNSSNNQIENPDINNSIDQTLLLEQGVAPNLDAVDCPPITDPVARNMAYGSIIGDSARYEENYYDFFYQNSRANLYSILKSDLSLLIMEDEADSSFEAFYNTMNATNIEKFDSVRSQIELSDYTSALQILNSINDTINYESALKNVLSICLNRSIVDSSLTSNDSTIFYEVANENQLLYGESSIIARNWLFYEVHDGALGQESRISNSNEKLETKFEVSIFPNPTTDNLYLKYKEFVPHQIKILDVNQRVILNSNNINYLNLKNFEGGVYFIQFIKDGRVLRTYKFVKL